MIIGSLLTGGLAFAVVVVATGCLALYELFTLGKNDIDRQAVIPVIIGGVVVLVAAYLVFSGVLPQEWLLTGLLVIICLLACSLFYDKKLYVAHQLFGLVYVILPLVLALNLVFPSVTGYNYTHKVLLGVLILIWLNDTGAYITGISAGRHPLFRRISPKKTWEGVAGGTFFTLAAAFFMKSIMDILQTSDWILIGIIVSVFGVTGDLFESMLKRNAGVKDSGNIIPGHGGVLDRIDSLLFVIPVVFVYLKISNF